MSFVDTGEILAARRATWLPSQVRERDKAEMVAGLVLTVMSQREVDAEARKSNWQAAVFVASAQIVTVGLVILMLCQIGGLR